MTPVNLNSIRKLRSLVPRYARIASRRSTYRPCAVYPDRRCFSTEEAAKEESKEGDDILSSSEEEPNEIKVIFPWRHDATPLPRLVEGTLDHARLGQRLSTATSNIGSPEMNTWASAFMFLDVPLYQFLFFSSWKEELADNMSWAFTQGVAGLLSTIASKNVPMNSIINDTYELNFHSTIGGTKEAEKTDESSESQTTADVDIPLGNMFEEKVISLFQSAKANIDKETDICLKTIPYSAELVSLYSIPYLSRRNTKSDKNLLSFYRAMMEKPSRDRVDDLNKLRKDKLEKGIMESTVIAQVLVWCNEVFYVKDVASGKVLQGTDDEDTLRNIPHLVRMESTVKTTKDEVGTFRNVQEDWIITDIDDMLEGNLIF